MRQKLINIAAGIVIAAGFVIGGTGAVVAVMWIWELRPNG